MVKPILPPIASPSPSITSSSNTLIEQPITTSPTTSNAATKIANHPRTYKTQLSDPEREREEIERELGDFGGDIPDDKMLVSKSTYSHSDSTSNKLEAYIILFTLKKRLEDLLREETL